MSNIKKNAFTIIELIIVIAVIGILMMATTVYLGGSDEKRKTIEAQGCANAIGGEINNFTFYTLTSKHLKTDDNLSISPSFYIVQLSGLLKDEGINCSTSNSGVYCTKILLSYNTGTDDESIGLYKTLSVTETCGQTKQPLVFYWSGENDTNIKYIKMNKGLAPRNLHDNNVFYIQGSGDNKKILLGDIITALCLNDDCTNPKEIGKFGIDSRSQTISRRNCKFYDEDPTKCKEREN